MKLRWIKLGEVYKRVKYELNLKKSEFKFYFFRKRTIIIIYDLQHVQTINCRHPVHLLLRHRTHFQPQLLHQRLHIFPQPRKVISLQWAIVRNHSIWETSETSQVPFCGPFLHWSPRQLNGNEKGLPLSARDSSNSCTVNNPPKIIQNVVLQGCGWMRHYSTFRVPQKPLPSRTPRPTLFQLTHI